MNKEKFEMVVEELIGDAMDVLREKGAFYELTKDRLGQFKRIGGHNSMPATQALWILRAKSEDALTINSDNPYAKDLSEWQELVRDNINYTIMFFALVMDELIQAEQEAHGHGCT